MVLVATGAVVAAAVVSAAKATEDRPMVAATISANTFFILKSSEFVSLSPRWGRWKNHRGMDFFFP